jgi:UrcA family protein
MKILIPLAVLSATLVVAPASAPAAEARQVVSYGDLDLSRSRDVAKLDRRIRTAVEAACGPASDADVKGKNELRRCHQLTLERVADQRARAIALSRPAAVLASTQ